MTVAVDAENVSSLPGLPGLSSLVLWPECRHARNVIDGVYDLSMTGCHGHDFMMCEEFGVPSLVG